jgi:plasmid stabilization system protein ParE
MIEISFHRLAAKEFREAFDWYASRDHAVADRFKDRVADAAERIRDAPDSHPVGLKHYRWVRVRRFPFRLIYEHLDAERVLIVAVAHSSRRSRYWRKRS